MRKFSWKVLLLLCFVSISMKSVSNAETLINGAGATFPYPIYSKWFDEYHKLFPDYSFNYQSIGSGGGIRQITAGTVDFGASDGFMSDSQLKDVPGKLLHIPTVMGAVVLVYNIDGVHAKLHFPQKVLADIFLGSIKNWNDPQIKNANPEVQFPDQPIIVVHRSDGSGTSFIFTDFLSKVSPVWANHVGRGTSVDWPVGLGGKGNEGVSGLVKQTPNSIGFVEYIYAKQNNIDYGLVANKSKNYVDVSLASISAAAKVKMPKDYRVSITNTTDPHGYPISGFTWILVYQNQKDPVKGKAIVNFLQWMLSDGQGYAHTLDYAPLPEQVRDSLFKTIKTIKIK